MLMRQRSNSAPSISQSQRYTRLLAALCIQRAFRAERALRRGRMLRGLWPSIAKIREELHSLRTKYLDPEAIEAGALKSHLYTDEQLILREICRSDANVKAAQALAWEAFSQGHGTLGKDAYLSMARRMYLVLVGRAKGRISATECKSVSEKEFFRDAAGKDHLTRTDLDESLFQLADVNTEGVSAAEYARFILTLVDAVARVRLVDGRRAGWEWRDDRAIWAELSVGQRLVASSTKALAITGGKGVASGKENKKQEGPVASSKDPSTKMMPATAPAKLASNSKAAAVFSRLSWLSAFEAARREEHALDAERARCDLDEPHTTHTDRVEEESAVTQTWATLLKARSRGLLSQRLSSLPPSSPLEAVLPSPRPAAAAGRVPAATPIILARLPHRKRGSLIIALSQARDELRTPAAVHPEPPLVRRRPRAFSHDFLAPIAVPHLQRPTSSQDDGEGRCPAPPAAAAPTGASPSPRARKVNADPVLARMASSDLCPA